MASGVVATLFDAPSLKGLILARFSTFSLLFREEWTFRGPGPIIPELLVFLTLSYCYSPGLLNENGQWSFALGG